jgi:hypothetical protein
MNMYLKSRKIPSNQTWKLSSFACGWQNGHFWSVTQSYSWCVRYLYMSFWQNGGDIQKWYCMHMYASTSTVRRAIISLQAWDSLCWEKPIPALPRSISTANQCL